VIFLIPAQVAEITGMSHYAYTPSAASGHGMEYLRQKHFRKDRVPPLIATPSSPPKLVNFCGGSWLHWKID
jgi:hypothetical protein